MRINARNWRRGFAFIPMLIQDEWVWLERIEYRTTTVLGMIPMFEVRKYEK